MTDADRAALTALVERALSLARQATNGWACYAKTKLEHDDIGRLHREIDDLAALIAAGLSEAPAPQGEQEPPAKVKHAVFLYLNTLVITSDNIGDVRRSLFMPFDCKWNGWVRDMTAELENKSSAPAPLPAPQEGK